MKRLVCLIIPALMSSCTVSLTLANTHGQASDVVDSTPTTSTEATADIKVPVSAI